MVWHVLGSRQHWQLVEALAFVVPDNSSAAGSISRLWILTTVKEVLACGDNGDNGDNARFDFSDVFFGKFPSWRKGSANNSPHRNEWDISALDDLQWYEGLQSFPAPSLAKFSSDVVELERQIKTGVFRWRRGCLRFFLIEQSGVWSFQSSVRWGSCHDGISWCLALFISSGFPDVFGSWVFLLLSWKLIEGHACVLRCWSWWYRKWFLFESLQDRRLKVTQRTQ